MQKRRKHVLFQYKQKVQIKGKGHYELEYTQIINPLAMGQNGG